MAFPVAVQVKMELDAEIYRLNQDPRLRKRRGPFRQRVTRGRTTCRAIVVDRFRRRVKKVRAVEYSALAP